MLDVLTFAPCLCKSISQGLTVQIVIQREQIIYAQVLGVAESKQWDEPEQ